MSNGSTKTLNAAGEIHAIVERLEKAVRLVLALDATPPRNQVPGYCVRLDPQAKKQLLVALGELPTYDPCDFSTYISDPARCDGCGYKGDPAREGRRYEPGPGEKRDPDLSYWFCKNCEDE